MYIEIYKQGKLKKRLSKCLSSLSWDNEMMYVPECTLTLPAEYAEYFDGREDVRIHVNGKIFWGHLKNNYTLDKSAETIELPLSHIVCEWNYRQISINHAISDPDDKDNVINVVYRGDKVKKNKNNDEGITASDFKVSVKEAKKISDEDLITKAYAQAWRLSNGDPIPIAKVDRGKLTNKTDNYDISFSTAQGTSVKVECEVKENVNVGGLRYKTNKTDKEKITARRFTIDIDDVSSLTNKEILRISQAKAWVLRHPKDKIGVRVAENTIEPFRGSYTVKLETETGNTHLTIDVRVDEIITEGYENLDQVVIDKLRDIYDDTNMAYPGWQIDYQDGSENTLIDYVYSREGKLDALTKTMENTTSLFWRVGFTGEKLIEIGEFGEHKPYMISVKPSGQINRRMITEPSITPDYENVINVATVYSAKSDGGMSSLTLREVYMDTEDEEIKKLKKKFPVVILHSNVNNERDYTRYITQYPELAPNNELEYAVLDTESIALESGILIEGTYAFNDLGTVNTWQNKLTNKQRKRASKQVYKAAIRKLKEARRNYRFEVTVEEMPPDVNVGDKIRVLYDNSIWNLDGCSNYWKKILRMDDWFYIEKMSWDIESDGRETNTLTLVKYLKIDRETGNGI